MTIITPTRIRMTKRSTDIASFNIFLRIAIPRTLRLRASHPLRDGQDSGIGTAQHAEAAENIISDALPGRPGYGFDVEEGLKITRIVSQI
jgi:hypothetical protein